MSEILYCQFNQVMIQVRCSLCNKLTNHFCFIVLFQFCCTTVGTDLKWNPPCYSVIGAWHRSTTPEIDSLKSTGHPEQMMFPKASCNLRLWHGIVQFNWNGGLFWISIQDSKLGWWLSCSWTNLFICQEKYNVNLKRTHLIEDKGKDCFCDHWWINHGYKLYWDQWLYNANITFVCKTCSNLTVYWHLAKTPDSD